MPFGRIVEEERPSLQVVRAADVPAMRSEETPGWAGRLLSASHRRGTFDLYAIDIEAGGEPPRRGRTTAAWSSTSSSSRAACGSARSPARSTSTTGDLVTFAADVPHVYEALETTHAVLLMSYP